MTLKANALISVDELITSMELSKLDLKVATFSIYEYNADSTASTCYISNNKIYLTITGGANAGSWNYDLTNASYDTLTELCATITALNKGFFINLRCSGSFVSTDLYTFPSKDIHLEVNELTLTGFNSLLLHEYINTASQFIETYCNRKFVSASYTEYLNGTGSDMLLLTNIPVSSVTVKEFDNQTQTDLATLTNHTDYEVLETEGMIQRYGIWGEGIKLWKVAYTGGYATADMPEDLKDSCKQICKMLYNTRLKQGIANENDGARTVAFDRTANFVAGVPIPASIIAMLIPYARQDTVV